MDLYPIDLVLAAALAWTTIFLGYLPTRQIVAPIFRRHILAAALAWIVVGLTSPPQIIHYDLLLAVLCLISWHQLRHDHRLAGKLWLIAASGLGISLGVVLILAVTPQATPLTLSIFAHTGRLLAIYLGGAVTGLAYALHVFTRREATHEGISPRLVLRSAQLLFLLTLARAASLFGLLLTSPLPLGIVPITLGITLFLLAPSLAWAALQRSHSPAPSRAGPPLLALVILQLLGETTSRWLGW
jgi:hypothetical protein